MIHVAVDHWIVHGVRHCQPISKKVNFLKNIYYSVYSTVQSHLYVLAIINIWIYISSDEVSVIWEPADNENDYNHYHHLNNLKAKNKKNRIQIFHHSCWYLYCINIYSTQTFLLDLILSVCASVASPMDLLPQSSSPTLFKSIFHIYTLMYYRSKCFHLE